MIWRRLLIPEDFTLFELHRAIQIAFGWEDYHLHAFKLHGRRYNTSRTGQRHRDAAGKEVKLIDLQLRVRQRILYEYDFGDLWQHEIRVEAKIERNPAKNYPACADGARAGPPEDVGGPGGYEVFLFRIGAGDDAPSFYDDGEPDDGLPLDFDPQRFSRREVNAALKREFSATTRS